MCRGVAKLKTSVGDRCQRWKRKAPVEFLVRYEEKVEQILLQGGENQDRQAGNQPGAMFAAKRGKGRGQTLQCCRAAAALSCDGALWWCGVSLVVVWCDAVRCGGAPKLLPRWRQALVPQLRHAARRVGAMTMRRGVWAALGAWHLQAAPPNKTRR